MTPSSSSHPAFRVIRAQRIDEVDAYLTHYEHIATGARVLNVRNADDNRVFGVTFATPPHDSTGLPHVLEHSVLAGSERYPVKEPFVELVKGSLNTFLNAMTFADRTCYPVASQNLQDLRNLMDVYLDAVLHPLLPPRILDQEGWHYEIGASGELGLKGVVYNEMKGVYSNPDSLLGRLSRKSLFPDTPYRHDSGGDPSRIPDLTYDAFRSYHVRYYHPTNALVYFSGDDPEEERLQIVAAAFQGYTRGLRAPPFPLQPRWDGVRVARERYAAGDDPAHTKSMVSVNWLLADHTDPERALGLNVLSEILLGTPASPLRRALIESGLGEGLTHSGLDDESREATFSAGLRGVSGDDAGKIEDLIRGTLHDLARDGIDPQTVAAALNTVEFALRENNTGPYPRGLILMLRCLPGWMYLDDPFVPLRFAAPLESIRNRVERRERYFEELIRVDLVENRHSTVVLLEPDRELGAKQIRAERSRLEEVRRSLSPTEHQAIRDRMEELERFHSTPDDPAVLARIPTLGLDDLERKAPTIPAELVSDGPAPILAHDIPSSGVVYLDLGFDVRGLDPDLLPLLPLYTRCLTEMGTTRTDYIRLQQRIGRDTGGLRASTMTSAVLGSTEAACRLFLRGKCLVRQLDRLLELMAEVLSHVRLDDRSRFLQMAREAKARAEASVVPAGHSLVAMRLGSKFDEAGWIRERVGGVDQLFFVRRLGHRVETDWPGVEADLMRLHAAVVNRSGLVANLTVSPEERKAVQDRLGPFLGGLPSSVRRPARWSPDWRRYDEGLTAPTQVNFAGKGAQVLEDGQKPHGSVFAILKHLRTTWIWDKVRVQGGAYGGMVQFDPLTGVLAYLSYRDPNLLETLEIYDRTADYLAALQIGSDELRKSIIGAVGDMDPCLLPDAAGLTSLRRHLSGVTDRERQRLRDELLATAPEDFRRFAQTARAVGEGGIVVALGSPEKLAQANTALNGRLKITAVV